MVQIRIKYIYDAITLEEVGSAVADVGGFLIDYVKVGEISRKCVG